MGTSQSTTGLVTIASTNGPASSGLYAPVGGTFVVASSGIYYFAVSATSNGASGEPVLRWDDLSVTIPCSEAANLPSINIVASPSLLCVGQVCTVTATGAYTYTWNVGEFAWVAGPTVPTITYTPSENAPYAVAGTNNLTGCTATLNAIYVPFFLNQL